MRDIGYKALLCGLILTHKYSKDRTKLAELLDHLKEILRVSHDKHSSLLDDCLKCQYYMLHVSSQQVTHESLVLYIFNEENCRQFTINQGEPYSYELGDSVNYKLKCSVNRFNGEKKNTVVRANSLIRRMIQLDRRDGDCVVLNTIPLNSTEMKVVCHKGQCYALDIRITRERRSELIPPLCFDDLVDLMRSLNEWEACSTNGEYGGEMSDASFALLNAICQFHQVPYIVQKLVSLSILLVWDYSLRPLDDTCIRRIMAQLGNIEDVKNSMTSPNSHGKAKKLKDFVAELCSAESSSDKLMAECLRHLSQCLEGEILEVLERFNRTVLFPPEGHLVLKKINVALKQVVDICMLSVWDESPENDPSLILSKHLSLILRDSALRWVEEDFHPDAEDIKETCLLVQSMWDQLQQNYQSSNLFFHQFNINYVQIVLSTIDEKLESSCLAYLSSRLSSLDSRCQDQLELFSKCTMRFYETIAAISNFAMENRVKHLRLHSYEKWFIGVTVFWTYSWREITLKMVERTLSLDDDGDDAKTEYRRPVPAGLYSFLCIQKGLSDDYTILSFKQPDNIMMGTIALVHIYSENVCAYAKKLYKEAMTDDNEQNCHLVRASNGIEQAVEYIEERWSKFVNWQEQKRRLTEDEGNAVKTATENIMESMKKRCDALIANLVSRYCILRRSEVNKIARSVVTDYTDQYLNPFFREVTPLEHLNAILHSVDALADDFRRYLFGKSYEFAVKDIFRMLEEDISVIMKKSHNPHYYMTLYITIKAIMDLLDIDAKSSKLTSMLHLRSFSTEELILAYYGSLCDMVDSASADNSVIQSIQMQIGQIPAAAENVLVIVNVIGINSSIAMNPLYDRIDAFVKVELLPRYIFPEITFQPQKTRTITQVNQFVWKQDFQILVPQDLFYTNGACLCISVLDHDRLCDQLLGRSFISLNKIALTNSVSKLEDAKLYVLYRPTIGHNSVFYKMLRERSRFDSIAREFLKKERSAREMYAKVLVAYGHCCPVGTTWSSYVCFCVGGGQSAGVARSSGKQAYSVAGQSAYFGVSSGATVYQIKHILAEQPHQHTLEYPAELLAEQPHQHTLEYPAELLAEQPHQHTLEYPAELLAEQQHQHTLEYPAELLAEQPHQHTLEYPAELLAEQPHQHTLEYPAELLAEQPHQHTLEYPAELLAEQPHQHTLEYPAELLAEQQHQHTLHNTFMKYIC